MKIAKIPAPMSIVLTICDKDMSDELETYLTEKHLKNGIIFSGKGTSESNIADIFGFGIEDRSIFAVMVPSDKKDKYLKDIVNVTRIEKDQYGLAMLIDPSSASSPLLELMCIEV